MLEAVSALNGAACQGYVKVEELGLQGMITLRGDLSLADMKNAATGVAGVDMPGRREIRWVDQRGLAWMSPDELLALVPYAEVSQKLEQIRGIKGKHHYLAVDVSDARAMFRISGKGVREVIAKLCPVDMSEDAFAPGQIRRTRMAQVPAAIWMTDAQTIHIVCFRSVAQYVFDLLRGASEAGSEVGYPG